MRKGALVVFDEVLAGTPSFTVYTDVRHNEALGAFDKLSIQAIADQVANHTAYTLSLEQSNDGRNWNQKGGAVLFTRASMAANNQYLDVATDSGSTPTLALVRFAINVTTGTAGSMHLKIIVCLRDEA